MTDFYDSLETRDPEERERDLFTALKRQLSNARENAPYFADLMKDVDPGAVDSREAPERALMPLLEMWDGEVPS